MRPRIILAVALLFASAGCLGGGLRGEPSPPFEVVTSDGLLVNETTHLGKWVILDLMATWCGPCKLEVGHLREVQKTFGDDVIILSISVEPLDTSADLDAFSAEHGATWPYAIDRDGAVKTAMGMRIIPKLIILDPQGVVAFEEQGEVAAAAITRIIDPSVAPSPVIPLVTALAALALGSLGVFNPYRRHHRDAPGAGPTLSALGIFAVLAVLAWPFSALTSSRATYGSLLIGAATLLGALWWLRVRSKPLEAGEGTPFQRGGDRFYELGPAFAGALVMALLGIGAIGFFAPLAGFFAGAAAGFHNRERVPERYREWLGVLGLLLAGAGLLVHGSRILAVESLI